MSEPEAIGTPESVIVPAGYLLAAQMLTNKKEAGYRRCVYLHADPDPHRMRIAATDGSRLFVGRYAVAGERPSWAQADHGLLLDGELLKSRVSLLAREGDQHLVVSFAAGLARATLADRNGTATFSFKAEEGVFPDYDALLDVDSFAASEPLSGLTINGAFLKEIAAIAQVLEVSAIDKRPPAIRQYTGGSKHAPVLFDFPNWPGVVLMQLPQRSETISSETVRLLAPAMQRTVAALKAHQTRNEEWARKAKGEERKAYQAKATEFASRIEELAKSLAVAIEHKPAEPPAEPSMTEAAPEAIAEPTPATRLGDAVTDRQPRANRRLKRRKGNGKAKANGRGSRTKRRERPAPAEVAAAAE